jgi:hypothetical protein
MNSHPDPQPDRNARPRAGFIESFANREARWKAVVGFWEPGHEGVRVAPGRVAGWYVCRAVRPPDYSVMELTLAVTDAGPGPTAAAALSIMTDQGHRALSAAVEILNNRLMLMGVGTEVLGHAQLPAGIAAGGECRLTLRRNGSSVSTSINGVAVNGTLRRSIKQGLIAFWTDPGVEAVFRQLSVFRAWKDEAPFESLPPDWEPVAGSHDSWSAGQEGLRHEGPSGTLVKGAGSWDDVQVCAAILRPDADAWAGIGLRSGDGTSISLTLSNSAAGISWEEGGAWHEERVEASPEPEARLTLRRIGTTAHAWVDDRYLGGFTVPDARGEVVLLASGEASFQSVEAIEWL